MTRPASTLAAFAASFAAGAMMTAASAQDRWIVDPAQSAVSFSGVQEGTPFDGHFSAFTADILLDPADPSTGKITAEIDLASADAGNDERNESLPTSDWFSIRKFPTATFVSDSITRRDDGSYVAAGTLTLKGISKPLVLPFTLAVDGDIATAEGAVSLDRTDFNVGAGAFSKGDFVALPVGVTVSITAHRDN